MPRPPYDAVPQRPPLDRTPLDPTRLDAAALGWPEASVQILDEAPSTNAVAAQWARREPSEGLVVVAEHQTAGRGRLDRQWETPARAALTFSVVLRPDVDPVRWPWLPLLAGVAATRALRVAGAPVGLKWPNDLLLAERKVGGILAERVETPHGPAAIIGIGLNVTTRLDELPVPTATSLSAEGIAADRTDLLAGVLVSLREVYQGWLAEPGVLRAAYSALCVTVPGRTVRVALPDGSDLTGQSVEVAEDGGLTIDTAAGRVSVHAGDVLHVRPVE